MLCFVYITLNTARTKTDREPRMKKITSFAMLVLMLAAPSLQANITNPATEMASFRAAISSSLFLATNGITAPDKKVVATLKKAIASIDKTAVTNISADAKTLSTVVGALSRSAVSNELSGSISNVLDYFFSLAGDGAYDSSNRLNNAFASGTKTAAARNIALIYSLLNISPDNYPAFAKAISTATKKLLSVDKLVTKALNVPPPPNGFTAKISATDEGTFTYKPIVQSVQATYSSVTKTLNVTSTLIKASRSGSQTRSVGFLMLVPGDGTFTLDIASMICYYSTSEGPFSNPTQFSEGYEDNTGTMLLNLNTTTKKVSGSFNFSGHGSNVPSRTATVEGSFTITYLE